MKNLHLKSFKEKHKKLLKKKSKIIFDPNILNYHLKPNHIDYDYQLRAAIAKIDENVAKKIT